MGLITETDIPRDVVDRLDSATLQLMLDGLNAKAARVAPCLDTADPAALAEARLILVGAVGRWSKAGEGAVTQQGAGPFQQTIDTRQSRTGWQLWPTEIAELQSLCGAAPSRAFEVDTTPAEAGMARQWVSTTEWIPLLP